MPTQPAAFLRSLASDARFALRHFSRHKSTTAIIVAVLALSTGANTLSFSYFQGAFLRPASQVPKDPTHALFWMQERSTPRANWKLIDFSHAQFTQLAEHRDVFATTAAWVEDYAIIAGGDSAGARNGPITFVTPNYFTALGVPLSLGRDFLPRDDGGADFSAVMAAVHAQQMFGSARLALGKRLLVNRTSIEIVGIAPERFRGATRDDVEPLLFIPLSARRDVVGASADWMDDNPTLSVFARLAPAASFAQATAVAQRLAVATLPDSAERVGMTRMAEVRHLGAVPPCEAGEEEILTISIFGALSLLILLVGWMNVSSLMVAAAVARRQEIALRLALGASRARVIRQLVTESTLISLVGATAGAIVAFWVLSLVSAADVNGVVLAPDVGTIVFVVVLAVTTGIVFGLSPALHATRGVAAALRDSGHGATGKSRLQRALVVAQIALSQPLLVALLTMMQMLRIGYQPMSVETSRVVVEAIFRPSADSTLLELGPEQVERLIPRLAARPEIRAVVPATMDVAVREVELRAAQQESSAARSKSALVQITAAAPGWFELLDVPIILGRDVMLSDTAASERPVVIGVDLARALFGDASPVGQRIHSPAPFGDDAADATLTVVGVYDSRVSLPGMPASGDASQSLAPFRIFTSYGKAWHKAKLLIRTRGPAAQSLPELQRFAIAEAPQLPIGSFKTLEQRDQEARRSSGRLSLAAAVGALVALTLASLGLYGVIALAVRQRTREIGIRIAVGAEPLQVARMFLASGMRSAAIGLAIGLPITLVALQVLIAQGEMRMPTTLPMFVGIIVAGLLLTVATLATWIPAQRAAQIDPGTTLRAE